MEQQYVTLITGFSSGLAGAGLALLSAYLTNRSAEKCHELQLHHDAEQREEELLRARGEELYTITSEWLKVMGTHQLRSMAVLYGTITYKQAIDQQLADGKSTYNFDRIEMLVDTYFPTAKADYKALLAERDNFNEMYFSFKHKLEKVGAHARDRQTILSHEQSLTAIETLGNAFKNKIVESLRAI